MRALLAVWRGAVTEAAANRTALASQVAIMFLNDFLWVVFWVLFFDSVGTVRGWDVEMILLLQAVLTTTGGLVLGVFANARNIGAMVVGGELDATLTLPVPTLGYVLLRRIVPFNAGDAVFGVVLFVVACDPTPSRTIVYVAASLGATVLVTSFLVLAGSLAFWTDRTEAGDLGFHGLLVAGAYPIDSFSGFPKAVLYTIVPAAFVSSVPAKLIDDVDPKLALALVAIVVVFAVLASITFRAGLRRYTSGSAWTRA
jgi:ABC-2 type transport system permease protein